VVREVSVPQITDSIQVLNGPSQCFGAPKTVSQIFQTVYQNTIEPRCITAFKIH